MDYAQTYHIGGHHSTRKKATTAIVPTVGRVRQLDAKNQGCQRNSERQTEVCTNSHVTNGFLKTSFLPKLKESKTVHSCKRTAKTERDFYRSLSRLAEHYKIKPMQTDQFEHPYNMALAIWDMEEKLKQRVLNWSEIRLVQDGKRTYFISEEEYDTGATLYYVPIEPLYLMLHDPKRKRNAQLLMSVCSYLYHIVDIPYYRQEDNYLFWIYETHKDWIEEEEEETEMNKREFVKAEWIGDIIEQKLFNRINLKVFEKRLDSFKSRDGFDHECCQVAHKAFDLYTEYPQESIFRNVPFPEENPYDDEYGTIEMEKYISFIADTEGWLYDTIANSINNELNEYGELQEPNICKCFDGSEITASNFDFEHRLFALLHDICDLLYNYKTIRK
ncbi:MAG TPA: hypothetical protein VLZ83_12225 [Edaphocola sp.]|nr:hypothetical protein [Edaphocola sp.]